jgi:cysteine desulfurase
MIYLDNNATTRVRPEVLEAMLPFLTEHWGNPSSAYTFGKQTSRHLDEARARVAGLIGAEPGDLVFTSCGTESTNTAIQSALSAAPNRRHVLTTAVEHSATLKFCKAIQKRGYDVTFLPVESDGTLDLHLLEQSIRPETAVVTVMWANNETGVLFPVEEIAALCRSRGVPYHVDAVQVPGKLPVNVRALGMDYLSLSGHKFNAPKGVGSLYINRDSPFSAYVIGGGQERGRRGGTENVAGIVGMGRAAELAGQQLQLENTRVRKLRDKLEQALLKAIPGASRNGAREPRLPNTSNLAFDGVEAEGILIGLDHHGICASSGSACTTGSLEPSHVLTAMGISAARARGSIRFSLGIDNTEEDINRVVDEMPGLVARLRAVTSGTPLAEAAGTVARAR